MRKLEKDNNTRDWKQILSTAKQKYRQPFDAPTMLGLKMRRKIEKLQTLLVFNVQLW